MFQNIEIGMCVDVIERYSHIMPRWVRGYIGYVPEEPECFGVYVYWGQNEGVFPLRDIAPAGTYVYINGEEIKLHHQVEILMNNCKWDFGKVVSVNPLVVNVLGAHIRTIKEHVQAPNTPVLQIFFTYNITLLSKIISDNDVLSNMYSYLKNPYKQNQTVLVNMLSSWLDATVTIIRGDHVLVRFEIGNHHHRRVYEEWFQASSPYLKAK